jgi:hypothetical protein
MALLGGPAGDEIGLRRPLRAGRGARQLFEVFKLFRQLGLRKVFGADLGFANPPSALRTARHSITLNVLDPPPWNR